MDGRILLTAFYFSNTRKPPHLISYSFRASHLVISAVVVFFRMFNFELSAWDGESLRGIARSPFCPSLRTPNDNNKRTEGGRTELGEGRVAKVRERESAGGERTRTRPTERPTELTTTQLLLALPSRESSHPSPSVRPPAPVRTCMPQPQPPA